MDPLRTQQIDRLTACLDSFIAAWDTGGSPAIEDHVPEIGDSLRPYALHELVKIDIEYRWALGEGQSLESYVAEFPELDHADGPAPDLIYEEYLHRRKGGHPVPFEQYLVRYPGRAEQLRTLSDINMPGDLAGGPKNIPEPGAVLDDFLLIEKLGSGTFATVFLARQQSLHRTVALKVSANRGEEAQTLAQLDHPNIVRVFDQRALPEQDLQLLYMEYVPAGSLEGVVDRIQETPPSERSGRVFLEVVDEALIERGEQPTTDSKLHERLENATWAETVCIQGAQLADALGYAHDRGVLHRDVKPANVLLSRAAAAKLADFNVSYSDHTEASSPEAYLGGSLAYMSPEHLEACSARKERGAATLDRRADVYSLGVLLFELLTGMRPFADGALGEDLEQAIDEMIERRNRGVSEERLRLIPLDAPRLLRPTLLRALAPDPAQRFDSATEMARQLDLCTLPRAAELIAPAADARVHHVRRRGLLALLLAAVVPSILLSVLNTVYNINVVVQGAERASFMKMVMAVNAVAFAVGIGILVAWIRPLAAAARQVDRGIEPDRPERERLRQQLLALPDRMMAVIFPLWVLGGLAFPVWLGLRAQSPPSPDVWVNFTGSNMLFGVLAATASFFLAMRLVLRGLYPPLVKLGEGSAQDAESLRRVGRRATLWFGVLTAVPFAAIISLALVDVRNREALLALGGIGSVSFGLAYRAMLAIRQDVRSLEEALSLRATDRG